MHLLKKHNFWAWVFLFWTFVLIIINLIPNYTPESFQIKDKGHFRTDYIQHLIVFMLLPFFYFLSGGKAFINRYISAPWLLIISGVMFSALAEVLQIMIPGRTYHPVDLLLNISGFILGVLIGWTARKVNRLHVFR